MDNRTGLASTRCTYGDYWCATPEKQLKYWIMSCVICPTNVALHVWILLRCKRRKLLEKNILRPFLVMLLGDFMFSFVFGLHHFQNIYWHVTRSPFEHPSWTDEFQLSTIVLTVLILAGLTCMSWATALVAYVPYKMSRHLVTKTPMGDVMPWKAVLKYFCIACLMGITGACTNIAEGIAGYHFHRLYLGLSNMQTFSGSFLALNVVVPNIVMTYYFAVSLKILYHTTRAASTVKEVRPVSSILEPDIKPQDNLALVSEKAFKHVLFIAILSITNTILCWLPFGVTMVAGILGMRLPIEFEMAASFLVKVKGTIDPCLMYELSDGKHTKKPTIVAKPKSSEVSAFDSTHINDDSDFISEENRIQPQLKQQNWVKSSCRSFRRAPI